MARLEYPPIDTPEAQQAAEQVKQERSGRLGNLFRIQLYNPAITQGWLKLGSAVRFHSELDAATRELAICQVARLTGAEYEWRAHSRLAQSEGGVSSEQLAALPNWAATELFDERQRAVLALAEGLTRSVQVDDATFDAVRPFLSARQIMELVTTVAYYNMVARFLVGLQVDFD
jgi:alkylhydroperoxidase family enzyme